MFACEFRMSEMMGKLVEDETVGEEYLSPWCNCLVVVVPEVLKPPEHFEHC